MIESIRSEVKNIVNRVGTTGGSENLSLCINRLCPKVDEPDKKEKEGKDSIIDRFKRGASTGARELYRYSFQQWVASCHADPSCITIEMTSCSPMIVGKSGSNIHEFGVALQHLWGVPVIPGSAVKGVISSYAHNHGGDDWLKSDPANEVTGGSMSLDMFGGIDEKNEGVAGALCFMDAWWNPEGIHPFETDIINCHYSSYYGGEGECPDGTESPVPVKFIVVRPGQTFFFAVKGGDAQWRDLAVDLLKKAAAEYGFGAKTRVGYGRMKYRKTLEDVKREIAAYTDKELAEFFVKNKSKSEFSHLWGIETKSRKYSQILAPLFSKYQPLLALLEDIRQTKPETSAKAKKIYLQYKNRIRKNGIDPADPDARAIFLECFPLMDGKIKGTWLEPFSFTAEHILEGKNEEEILDLIDGYDSQWPPLQDIVEAVKKHPTLSDECKELCVDAFCK